MKIFLSHIPKNAGTSINQYFIDLYGSDKVYGVDVSEKRDFMEYKSNIIESYDYIAGHIPLNMVEDHLQDFDYILCVVRDPFYRLISMANFITKTFSLYQHLNSLEKFTNEFYLKNIETRNEQCGYIGSKNTAGSVFERLANNKNIVLLRHGYIEEDFMKFCQSNNIGSGLLKKENANDPFSSKFNLTDLYNNEELTEKVLNWFSNDFLLSSAANNLAK